MVIEGVKDMLLREGEWWNEYVLDRDMVVVVIEDAEEEFE